MDFFYKTLISADQLRSAMFSKNLLVVDCRFSLNDVQQGQQEYHEAHIPNSIYAHLDHDLSGKIIPNVTGRHPLPDKETIASLFGRWGIQEDTQVIAYDHSHGGIAARLWFLLNWLGHDKVAVLDGGWNAWQAEGYEVNSAIPSPQSTAFKVNPSTVSTVSAEQIQALQNQPDWLICDSRTADRYRGENETIDPVAGHIPEAISVPFVENLGPDGRFLSKDELQKRFDDLLNDSKIERTIFYCGSGVTACHNLLALHHIGRSGAILYPGSWSDWITDSARPVALG